MFSLDSTKKLFQEGGLFNPSFFPPYKSDSFELIQLGSSDLENAIAVRAAYERAKSAQPNGQALGPFNRFYLILPQAVYNFGNSALEMDTPFIDIFPLNESIGYTFTGSGANSVIDIIISPPTGYTDVQISWIKAGAYYNLGPESGFVRILNHCFVEINTISKDLPLTILSLGTNIMINSINSRPAGIQLSGPASLSTINCVVTPAIDALSNNFSYSDIMFPFGQYSGSCSMYFCRYDGDLPSGTTNNASFPWF